MKEWFVNNKKSIIITAVVILTLAASFFLVGQPEGSGKKTESHVSYTGSIISREESPGKNAVSEHEKINNSTYDAISDVSKAVSDNSINEEEKQASSSESRIDISSDEITVVSELSETVSSEISNGTSAVSDVDDGIVEYQLSEVPYTDVEQYVSVNEESKLESLYNEATIVSSNSSEMSKREENSNVQSSTASRDIITSSQESSHDTQPSQEEKESSVRPVEADESAEQCTISISCANLLDNMDKLKKNKRSLVPEDGVILKETKVTINSGDSVFDITKRICTENMIPLEFTLTPLYNTAYIEGIYNLYEFDCGSGSGWMYTVNGITPSVGCSDITVNDGDIIHWYYTCNMGKDGE